MPQVPSTTLADPTYRATLADAIASDDPTIKAYVLRQTHDLLILETFGKPDEINPKLGMLVADGIASHVIEEQQWCLEALGELAGIDPDEIEDLAEQSGITAHIPAAIGQRAHDARAAEAQSFAEKVAALNIGANDSSEGDMVHRTSDLPVPGVAITDKGWVGPYVPGES